MTDKELSPESLKRMVSGVISALKEIDSELIAYQMALVAMHKSDPTGAARFERFIQVPKILPSYQTQIHEKYELPLEQFLGKISNAQPVIEAVEEWLGVQKRKNSVN